MNFMCKRRCSGSPITRKEMARARNRFDVIYLLQIIGEKPKIFAYITGDEEKTCAREA